MQIEMPTWTRLAAIAGFLAAVSSPAGAVVDGVTGTSFTLTAKEDYIYTGEGGSIYMWGYALDNGTMQYPGPTLIVNQGDTITITLNNQLPSMPVSIVFPGQSGIVTTCLTPGPLTCEAEPMGSVQYSFVASRPGTFAYHSGSFEDLQIEMGLIGALIVRPTGFNATTVANRRAYGHAGAQFDREYLFLLTDIDAEIHTAVDAQVHGVPPLPISIDMSKRFATYWFINGRNGPDTLLDAFVPWLPSQPYNAMPRMFPGEKLLMRVVGGGLDMHPFHHHGNHAKVIARDGALQESAPGTSGPDLADVNFTIQTVPGQTYDAIWEWTGKGLGWDIYGHKAIHALEPFEDPADHGKPLPVTMPDVVNKISPGGYFSGSAFLGQLGLLRYDQGGLNINGGLFFMWHSHNEKELTNFNIFPGGMMTMVIVEPRRTGVIIP